MAKRSMPVSELVAALGETRMIGAPPAAIGGIAADSRKVAPGDCFVAVPGFKQDARRFVPEAIARGAAVIVTEGPPVGDGDVAQIIVPSARLALARAADAYYGHPSRQLTVVGITGTNGKTTTSYLVDALLQSRGLRTGVIGTIQYRIGAETLPAGQTTPEALELQSMLARMYADGVRAVAMEVSSHALALARVEGLTFDVAVFTNLTQDHLDFHGTLDEYRRAKRRLFELLAQSPKPGRTAVVNADDPSGGEMVRGLQIPSLSFGLGAGAQIRGGDRDRGKRPIMGEIAARLADRVWVTSDNPRSERPDAILDEIVVGVRRGGGDGRYGREVERRTAIGAALDWARSGDTVVIAGKGHETYQIVGAEVLPFDDREVARQLLMRKAG